MGVKNIKKAAGKLGVNAAEKAKALGGVAAEKARHVGGKVAVVAKEQGSVLAARANDGLENAKASAQERKLKKLAPVFAEEYFAKGYDLPYLVVVVDEDQRKGEELCEGAIGWLSSQDGMEVLNMYYAFTPECGIRFYPKPQIGAAYYIDVFDSKRYIDLDHIFQAAEQDQITELRNIAYSLGAKACRLLSINNEQIQQTKKARGDASVSLPPGIKNKASATVEANIETTDSSMLRILFEQQFEGSDNPVMPELKWFVDDLEILSLIDMRCGSKPNSVKRYSIEIDSSKYSALKKDQAAKIDAALKGIKFKAGSKMEQRLKKELQKSLLYEIEF